MNTKIQTENCLRNILKAEGYQLSSKNNYFNFGPEIKATKEDESWYIEVIGFKDSGLARMHDFYEAFFQAISRLNRPDCKHIVLAMPLKSKKLLPIRAKIYRIGWQRIASAFPELEIWLVDTNTQSYNKTTWAYWLDYKP